MWQIDFAGRKKIGLNYGPSSFIIGRTWMKNGMNQKAELQQVMSLWDAVLLVMGSVIGSGIFMTTGFIVEFVRSPGAVLLVWVTGGVITVFGALSFGELAGMFPRAGGQFIYLKEAYGDLAGFLFGWTFFWVIMGGGVAALAVGFTEYLGYSFPGLSNQSVILSFSLGGVAYSLSAGQIIAFGLILLLSAVNYFGVRSGLLVQNLFTVLRVGCLGMLLVFGWLVGKKAGLPHPGAVLDFSGGLPLKSFGLALFAALWTYDGWYSVNCTAEEIKKPRTTIPLSLLLGTLAITVIYLLMNLLYLVAVPIEKMSGVARIGELAATAMFGPRAASFIAAAILASIFGCLSATILYGPRVYYAMAEAGLFFRGMSRVHPRYHVPSRAIVGQAVWSALLCLSGTYQGLFEYVIFALVLFFAATGAAVVALRSKRPDLPRPYRAWGYPVVPLIFVAVNLTIFVNRLASEPQKSLLGLAMILAGLPAYFFWKRRGRTAAGRARPAS
jgi:APA family basic amino acid/polyamine antiporter